MHVCNTMYTIVFLNTVFLLGFIWSTTWIPLRCFTMHIKRKRHEYGVCPSSRGTATSRQSFSRSLTTNTTHHIKDPALLVQNILAIRLLELHFSHTFLSPLTFSTLTASVHTGRICAQPLLGHNTVATHLHMYIYSSSQDLTSILSCVSSSVWSLQSDCSQEIIESLKQKVDYLESRLEKVRPVLCPGVISKVGEVGNTFLCTWS